MTIKILEFLECKQMVTSAGVEHLILELNVGDRSGSTKLVLWNEKIIPDLKIGDRVKTENGFVTFFKSIRRINVGRYGEVKKI